MFSFKYPDIAFRGPAQKVTVFTTCLKILVSFPHYRGGRREKKGLLSGPWSIIFKTASNYSLCYKSSWCQTYELPKKWFQSKLVEGRTAHPFLQFKIISKLPKWLTQVFLTIWDPFGPIWTPLENFRQKCFFVHLGQKIHMTSLPYLASFGP